MKVKHPDVTVKLVGEDGNVFSVIGRVTRGLRRGNHADAAIEFENAAFNADSYDEVLRLAMAFVKVL